MDWGERGMNPVALTIIHPRKEYWLNQESNQRPPVPKSGMLQSELWGSVLSNLDLPKFSCETGKSISVIPNVFFIIQDFISIIPHINKIMKLGKK